VVFDQVPWGQSPLLSRSSRYKAVPVRAGAGALTAAAYMPECGERFLNWRPPILFMHGMRTASGQSYLVVVQGDFLADSAPVFVHGYDVMAIPRRLETWNMHPVSRWNILRGDVDAPLMRPAHLRVFAGQVDSADPSHFTIRYEYNEKPGMVDGWLKGGSNGSVYVELKIRPPDPARP